MKKIDGQLQAMVDKGKTPSVTYLLFNKDSILHSFSSGYADIINKSITTQDTTYSSFSVTKTFTALAILQLAEKGQLSIDDEVNKYKVDFPYSKAVTIRQLLNHSSGIPNPLPLRWVHLPEEKQSFNRNEFFRAIYAKNNKLKFEPNDKFSYSNLGYVTLGQIIESISEEKYEDYIHNNIIDPLGIRKEDLDFQIHNKAPHAKGYQKKLSLLNFMLGFLMDKSKSVDKTEGKWISFKDMLINGASHGGLIGTPTAFMKYIQSLLDPRCKIISAQYKKLLFVENRTNANKETGMCLSWFKGILSSNTYYAHAGGGAGYYCEIRIYPEEGIGSVIMFNRTGVKDERILNRIDINYFDN